MMDTCENQKKSLIIGSGKPFADFQCKRKINFLEQSVGKEG